MSARTALVMVIALALVGAAVIFWPRVREQVPTPGIPRPATWYEIYFTDPKYPDKPEYHHGGIDEKLVAIVDQTKRTLDVCIYDFDLDNVASAMARAKQRGVTVRMVTDTDTLENKDELIQAALRTVRAAEIPIVDDQRRPIMHNKFVVSDGEIVLTGSWNFTVNDTYHLNNNAVRIRSRELAANYSAEFEKMFTQHKFGPTKSKEVPNPRITIDGARIETYFASEKAPRNPADRIVELVKGAQKSVDFLAFSFTDDQIGQALVARAKAGVKVRGVFETTGSETRFSEYGTLKKDGLEVYQDGNPYVMHHKVFVVDGHVTVFGSFNFSDNAANDNDENMLVVDDAAFARSFMGEMERIVARAKAPLGDRAKDTREVQ
jgi:phosphatidylserine/phosphatidylglycerophosphate/cardiolipin synthase-like enzyme